MSDNSRRFILQLSAVLAVTTSFPISDITSGKTSTSEMLLTLRAAAMSGTLQLVDPSDPSNIVQQSHSRDVTFEQAPRCNNKPGTCG